MSIGILALGFALLCLPVALYGITHDKGNRHVPQPDYLSIYKALTPKDL